MCSDSEVLLQPGHKWNNIVFYNHTGLKMYPHYMCGPWLPLLPRVSSGPLLPDKRHHQLLE